MNKTKEQLRQETLAKLAKMPAKDRTRLLKLEALRRGLHATARKRTPPIAPMQQPAPPCIADVGRSIDPATPPCDLRVAMASQEQGVGTPLKIEPALPDQGRADLASSASWD